MNVAYPGGSDDKNYTLTCKKKVKGQNIPYFPANGLRGRMRRFIAKRLLDALTETQGAVPTDIFLGLQSGSSHTQPDKANSSVEEIIRSAEHPYMGVFGGGSRMLESRYAISDINPILAETLDAGVVQAPSGLLQDIVDSQVIGSGDDVSMLKAYQIVEKRSFIKIDDIVRGTNLVDVSKKVEGGVDAIAAHLDAVSDNQAIRKEEKKSGADISKKLTLSNMLGVESICAGVDMHFRIDVSPDLTEAQIGVVLLALEDLANQNYLGGWGRTGFGRFSIRALIVDLPSFDIDETVIEGLYKGEVFSVSNETLIELTDAGKEALQSVDRDEMIDYFTPREVAIKRGKEKPKA
jgi:CRISPR type IV-associated protein Csf2